MSAEERAQFEHDVNSGLVVLPQQIKIGSQSKPNEVHSVELPKGVIDAYNLGAIDPYNVHAMNETERRQLDADVENGLVRLPSGSKLNRSYMSTVGKLKELFTGEKRTDAATKDLPDYVNLPELQPHTQPGVEHSTDNTNARFAAHIGSLTGGPADIAKSITHNFPNIKAYQDDHGNVVLRSAENGRDYLITPGMTAADVARAIGISAAFAPAGGASSIAGATVRGAAAEAGLQGANALAGGREFDPYAVAQTAAISGAVPAAGALVRPLAEALGVGGGKAAARVATETQEAVPAASAAPAQTPKVRITSGVEANEERLSNLITKTTRDALDASAEGDIAKYKALMEEKADYEKQLELLQNKNVNTTAQTLSSTPTVPTAVTPKSQTVLPSVQPAPSEVIDKLIAQDKAGGLDATEFVKLLKDASAGDKEAYSKLVTSVTSDPATMRAAEAEGVAAHLTPAQVTDNQQARAVIQGMNTMPGAPGRAIELQANKAISEKANQFITKLGGTSDLSAVNGEVKTALTDTQKELDKKADLLYKQVKDAIPPMTDAPATSTLKFIGDRLDTFRGDAKNLSSVERKIFDRLSPKEPTEAEAKSIADKTLTGKTRFTAKEYQDYINGKLPKGEDLQPTYAMLDNMRREVGAALYKKQGVFKDEDSGLLSKLYGSLSNDQEAALKAYEAANPAADSVSRLWAQAKKTVSDRKDIEDRLVNLFGKQVDGTLLPQLSAATKSLAKGDETKLVNFIKAIPEDQRERVVATGLSQAFMSKGEMDFTKFANWYEAVQANKPAMNALMSNLPDYARESLQNWYKISKSISLAKGETRFTGVNTQLHKIATEESSRGAIARGLGTIIFDEVGAGGGAAVAGPAGAVVGGFLGRQVGKTLMSREASTSLAKMQQLINSPEFALAVKQVDSGNVHQAAETLSRNGKFYRLFSAAGNVASGTATAAKAPFKAATQQRNISDIENFLTNAINTEQNTRNSKEK